MPLPNQYFILLQKSCILIRRVSLVCNFQGSMIKDFPLLYFLGVFVLVGMTTLLPWNFFISLTNFWDYKFRNVSETLKTNGSTAKTDLQKEFTSYLSISSTVPNATFVIINALGTIHILREDVYSTNFILFLCNLLIFKKGSLCFNIQFFMDKMKKVKKKEKWQKNLPSSTGI